MSLELQPHLIGELVELRPLRAEDWERVFAAASDPFVWEQHPARDRYKEEVFREFFRGAMESGGAFAVIDRASGEIIGSTRYYNYDATQSEIEIGFTFLARRHWGGRYNGEMKRLMLEHIFRFLDNVVFRIGPENIRSRRAVEKIGGRLIERPTPPGLERVIYRIQKAAAH
jgi:RimJ/RimL family protein N-acetyltransferase